MAGATDAPSSADRDAHTGRPADSGSPALWENDPSLAETAVQDPPRSAAADTGERARIPSGRPRVVFVGAVLGAAALLAIPFLATGSNSSSKGAHGTPLKAADVPASGYLPQQKALPSATAAARSKSPSGKHAASSVPGRSSSPRNTHGPASGPVAGAHKSGHGKPRPGGHRTAKGTKKSTVIVPAVFAGADDMLLKNLGTGYCADVPNYGPGAKNDPVQQFKCQSGSTDNQMWNLAVTSGPKGPGGARLFVIRNTKDGLCMDLPNYGGQAAGTKVIEFSCDGTNKDNQLWYLAYGHQNHYQIRNLASHGLCLGVTGGTGAGPDARLQIQSCGSTAGDWGWSSR